MKLVSPLLRAVVYPCLARAGYLHGWWDPGDLRAITYHGVLPEGYRSLDAALDGALVSRDSLRRQLRLLKSRYNVISPDQLLRWCENREKVPPRSVLLTCDDGLLNTLTDMLPILQEECVPCLFFVTGAALTDSPQMLWYDQLYLMLRTSPCTALSIQLNPLVVRAQQGGQAQIRSAWWSLVVKLSQCDSSTREQALEDVRGELKLPKGWNAEQLEDSVKRRRFLTMTRSELKQLMSTGMAVGAHTFSHPVLSELSSELAWKEIAGCRQALEDALARAVWALAYPFGNTYSVTEREIEMAERAEYQCAFLNIDSRFDCRKPVFAIPRVHVTRDMSLPEFEAHVSGFHQGLKSCFRG